MSEKIQNMQNQLNEVTNIMRENMEKVLERDAELALLEDKSENLANSALEFNNGATRLKNKMWWQDKKQCLLIFFVVVVILLIIILPAALSH